VIFKTAALAWKRLHDVAPRYLAGLCVPAASTDNRHQSPDRGDLPTFTSAKLVFDLATWERYKAELT